MSATIKQVNEMMPIVRERIAHIDPCSLSDALHVCDIVCAEQGMTEDDAGHLLMCMRVMGWLIEFNDEGDVVANRNDPSKDRP